MTTSVTLDNGGDSDIISNFKKAGDFLLLFLFAFN